MGRSKEFEEKVVLEKAMHVFWQQGYSNTSMQELVDAMGIHRRSIYDTFGDKHNLFLLTLDLYETTLKKAIRENLSEEMTIHEQLKIIFSISIGEESHAGCFLVNAATELANVDPLIEEKIQMYFDHEEQQLFNILLAAQEKNELSAATDTKALASYLHNASVGIRVLSKTTKNTEKLNRIIEQTVSFVQ
ncbi:TetR/AcrR family transcriptional regulator [Enterococcus xiangfangensis]|uniref:TetR/AcrR family transcriptional regulator n=1 Tax=Enterococcus xiangfangensis TaxID=1296537 RepID=A0ABU3F869_9ENTE|nr:TetR/AcrR family transcriptional regulator [Enterococcus xiangfangensis]MDT2758866.1 TetR/AcrR family transcriptional regulator [Enterococcus xiangfangensis]